MVLHRNFLVFFLVTAWSCFSYSSGEIEEFSAGELKNIRDISQGLLQVRGIERRNIVSETSSMRNALNEVNVLLQQASVEVDRPLLKSKVAPIPQNAIKQSEPQMVSMEVDKNNGVWGRFAKKWKSIIKSDNSEADNTVKNRVTAKLDQASLIVRRQKNSVKEEMPAIWQFYVEPDPNQVKMKERLEKLEEEIVSVAQSSELNKAKIEALRKRLDKSLVESEESKFEPTITSITKHYRK